MVWYVDDSPHLSSTGKTLENASTFGSGKQRSDRTRPSVQARLSQLDASPVGSVDAWVAIDWVKSRSTLELA